MYCSHCGAAIAEADAKFCPSCGEPVSSPASGPASGSAQVHATQPTGSAVQARPKMALWKKILIGIGVFIIGVVALAMWATAPLVEPIEEQLALLKEGRIEEAYNKTAGGFRNSTSLDQFKQFIESNPILMKISDTSFGSKEWENNLGTVTGSLTAEDGSVIPVTYRLVHENETWKILSISFNPEDQKRN